MPPGRDVAIPPMWPQYDEANISGPMASALWRLSSYAHNLLPSFGLVSSPEVPRELG